MSQPPDWSGQDPQQPAPYGQQPYGQQPYGQPQQPPTGPPPDAYAGFWIRFLGALIDGIILGVVGSIVSAVIPGVGNGGIFGPYSWVSVALGAAYFGYLHSSKAGQTVGQLAVGIRVVDARTGGQVTLQSALLRWAMSYVSGLPLALGYLWMLWDPNKQTWHDKVGSTYVVKAANYPAPAAFGQR